MTEDNFNESNPESSNNQWFPILRYQKEFEVAGKEVSVNDWMRAVGKLEAKVAHEESVPLAEKIITKSIKKKRIDSTFSDLKVFKTIGKNKMTSTSSKLFLLASFELGISSLLSIIIS